MLTERSCHGTMIGLNTEENVLLISIHRIARLQVSLGVSRPDSRYCADSLVFLLVRNRRRQAYDQWNENCVKINMSEECAAACDIFFRTTSNWQPVPMLAALTPKVEPPWRK